MAMDIQTLLDLEEIKQLRYSFAWCLETSQPDALADLFTEDGVIEVGPWGKMVGQDKIRKGYGRAYKDAPPFTAMHAVTNPRIFITGDTAKGGWYLLDCVLRDKDPLQIIGIYNEDYRRVNGDWKIARMVLQYLWASHIGLVTADNPMTLPPAIAAEIAGRSA
jgi:ketosteroid isomerase-like protein